MSIREFLRKAEIYPLNATPHVAKHIEDEAVKAVVNWLTKHRNDTPMEEEYLIERGVMLMLIRELQSNANHSSSEVEKK